MAQKDRFRSGHCYAEERPPSRRWTGPGLAAGAADRSWLVRPQQVSKRERVFGPLLMDKNENDPFAEIGSGQT